MRTYNDETENNGKLKPEVKTEWITLLRSGEVEQTTGVLRRMLDVELKTFGYCCLGVLSDMFVKANTTDGENGETDNPIRWNAPDDIVGSMTCELVTPEGTTDGMPTFDVNQWAFESGSCNGWYIYVDEADAQKYERYLSTTNADANTIYLAQMNDGGGTFADIADIIEKYL